MTRRARLVALTVSVTLVLAACSAPGTRPGSGTGSPAAGGGSGTPRPGGTAGGSGSAGGPPASATPGSGGGTARTYPDGGGVGEMARSYLRAAPATELRVEVDWVSGRAPSRSALDHLRSVLLSVVRKSGGVIVEQDQELQSSRTSWRLADIVALERTARQRHSSGATATMWIAYLGGSFADNESALGVAYTASSYAVFPDRIADATTAVILASEIERSVVTHEAGHLLALVNIGYRSRVDHEDPEHEHHSKNPDSVMYWQVEDVSIRNLLNGGPPSDFDADDRADLAMLREGG